MTRPEGRARRAAEAPGDGSMGELVDRLAGGDVRALARAISLVEEDDPRAPELLRATLDRARGATVIGVTGSPGSGKSTLVDRLVSHYRGQGRRVGVLAVDPSSAFSGGAILGDRVRMMRHAVDPEVFIRSMATRGHLGGLARAANDVVDLLDAAGYDPIVLETVGVGQDEVEVAKAADVVAVVLVPGLGDDIQAIKAGILEIADLFVINKADLPGADRVAADLEAMMSLAAEDPAGRPEIVRTVAVRGEGIPELAEALARALERRGDEGRRERRVERARLRFLDLLARRLVQRTLDSALPADALERLLVDIAERRTDPYSAVQSVLEPTERK